MVLRQEIPREVCHPDPDVGLVQCRHQDRGPARGETDEAWRTAAGGGAEFAFVDEAKLAEHGEPIRDDGAAERTGALKLLARGCGTAPHQVQEIDEGGAGGFRGARTTSVPAWPWIALEVRGIVQNQHPEAAKPSDKDCRFADQEKTSAEKIQKIRNIC